jgi:nicotinamide mononucleotide (NMN) deamidase PncC
VSLITAEAGTAGLLTNRLSTAPGAEAVFEGGFVANDAAALATTLHLPVTQAVGMQGDALEEFARNAASRLREGQEGVPAERRLGLVVVSLPRANEEDATSAKGTIITLATPEGAEVLQLGYGGHVDYAATWATTNALEMVRRWLLKR